jgi:hypothetical protein
MTRRRHARQPKPAPFRYPDLAPPALNLAVLQAVKIAIFQAQFVAAMRAPT